MMALVKKFGLFYLTTAMTFFFLCAYSLAASAPNFPFLPAMFLPIYLSNAVAMSERETGDPLLGVLPISPGEIMKVKFSLAFILVVVSWLNMALFTALQGLPPAMAANVMKLNTIFGIIGLILAAAFQYGIHFFSWGAFHKVIIGFAAVSGVFGIAFFVGLAKKGLNYPGGFPLIPVLETIPGFALGILVIIAVALYHLAYRRGPWNPRRQYAG